MSESDKRAVARGLDPLRILQALRLVLSGVFYEVARGLDPLRILQGAEDRTLPEDERRVARGLDPLRILQVNTVAPHLMAEQSG